MEQLSLDSETEIPRAPVVLIVEDEFQVRWVAAEYLREAAYSVIEASNAADGIPMLLTSGLTETLPRFYRGNTRRYIPKPYTFPDVDMQIRDMLQSCGP